MNKRKMLTIIIVAIILVATISWVVIKAIGNKKSANPSSSSQPKNSSNMFNVQNIQNGNNTKVIEISGSVKEIVEKTITITTSQGDVAIGINGSTPVMLSADKNAQPKVGQIADVRLNDSVDVQYDQNTKEAHLITITQKASDKAAAVINKVATPVKK